MNATELRARQAPLKEQYRSDPGSALTSVSARADWRGSGVTTSVDTWSGRTRAGLHEATGGDGDDACSADMLLEAVLACAGVTCRSVEMAGSRPCVEYMSRNVAVPAANSARIARRYAAVPGRRPVREASVTRADAPV